MKVASVLREDPLPPLLPPRFPPSQNQGWKGREAAGRGDLAAWVACPGLPGPAPGSKLVDPLLCSSPSPHPGLLGAHESVGLQKKKPPPGARGKKGGAFPPSQLSCRCPLRSSQNFTQFFSIHLLAQRSRPPRANRLRFSHEKIHGGPNPQLASLPTGHYPSG